MGKIYQLNNPINHRIANRNQGVDTPQGYTVNQLLKEKRRLFKNSSKHKKNLLELLLGTNPLTIFNNFDKSSFQTITVLVEVGCPGNPLVSFLF